MEFCGADLESHAQTNDRWSMMHLGTDEQGKPISSWGRTLRPTAHFQTDAKTLDLSGEWDFRYHPAVPTDTPHPDFIDPAYQLTDQWRKMPVPAHWCLAPQPPSSPAYTNVNYPFPLDPPRVPDDNPTGDYRRTVNLAELPRTGRVILRLHGIKSCATIWLDGHLVGGFSGSRLPQDYDITELVAERKTYVLALRVSQFSAGSYLEDQDQWWLPGIFREIEILHRPDPGIENLTVQTDWDCYTGTGRAQVTIQTQPHTDVTIGWDLTTATQTQRSDADGRIEVTLEQSPAQAWTPEHPHLFTITAKTDTETAWVRSGFRRIEIVDGQLRANGARLILRGVNRHEINSERGRVYDETWVRQDLMLMKQHNVNAIRTSHYPPHPRLLDLCDEIGLWVMDECDIETHGFEYAGWKGNPASDPDWRACILDRVQRMVARDISHPAIMSWSLGNESGTGENLAAAAALVKTLDPSRPVHYEGDYEGDYQQFHSRMYPALEEIDAFFSASGPVATAQHACGRLTPAQCDHVRTLPYVMIECLHAMGTGPGGIDPVWERVWDHPTHAGGYVWEWRDHALVLPNGELGYGGDFGERLHDGNFVCDGLVDADSTPSAGLQAWANVVAPVRARLQDGQVVVSNRDAVDGYENLRLVLATWERSYELATFDLAAGQTRSFPLPQLSGPARIVYVQQAQTTPTNYRGALDATTQEPLPAVGQCLSGWRLMSVTELNAPVPADIWLPASEEQIRAEVPFVRTQEGHSIYQPQISCWRAPTDNDDGHGYLDYWQARPEETMGAGHGQRGPSSADRWRSAGLHLTMTTTLETTPHSWRARTASPLADFYLDSSVRWRQGSDRVEIALEANPEGQWPAVVPRIGFMWSLPADLQRVTWWGRGPSESYSDMRCGTWSGCFTAAADHQWGHTLVPQESASHLDTRALQLEWQDSAWLIEIEGAHSVSVCPYTPHELTAAAHRWELAKSRSWWLIVDGVHHGLGSRSCGPDVRPEFQAKPVGVAMSLRIARLR